MKVHLRMLGCRLNQAEIDAMARQFQGQGHEIVSDPAEADHFVVNTCAVTREATRSSRKLIRELNKANPDAETTVTGCYAQIAPEDIEVLPGVGGVVDNQGKDTLVESITGVPVETFDHEPLARESTPGATGRTRAFVKVQDGCDNACTFCVTTVARGAGRSQPVHDVVQEIRQLHAAGYQEAVLTGVHLGSYGYDLDDDVRLKTLVRAILDDTDIPRLRLSSLEPWDIPADFFSLWENPRLGRHLHLPLQSGCDDTLHRMRRNTTQHEFRQLVETARGQIADLSITTDVIVGFPGETEVEFQTSHEFIEAMDFARLHVFRYSKRPGTPAARMKGHVQEDVKKARAAVLLEHSEAQQRRFGKRYVGRDADVLWEQIVGAREDGFVNVGYTGNYVWVRGVHPRPLTNLITPARMNAYDAEKQQLLANPIIHTENVGFSGS